MKINAQIQDLNRTGIYIIKNIINNKFYIGSCSTQLHKRLNHHINSLQRNDHKNTHLQNAFNKYGEDNFIIEILEICDENILAREQFYLDKFDAINKGYNINPLASGTPNMSLETINKRKQSFTKVIRQSCDYVKQIKNNDMKIEDVPKKYLKMVNYFLNKKDPWNKGKKYESTDHLKVSKKIKGSRENFTKTVLNKQPKIQVFDENQNLIGEWNNSTELSNDSTNDNFILIPFLKLRNKTGRNGYPYHYLAKFNIKKSCFYNNSYKGLIFKIKPSQSEMIDEASDKLLENLEIDNQQPI